MNLRNMLLLSVLFVGLAAVSQAATVGRASIYAPAVMLSNNSGSLTLITLNVTNGNGTVKIAGPISVDNTTLYSAYTAAQYAANYLHMNSSKFNFYYNIGDDNTSVSGPSAGAAMSILAISALSQTPLRQGFTITGTIAPSGMIGEVGGVYDKVSAAQAAGLSFIIVPGVTYDPSEQRIYQVVQNAFTIPMVPADNVSEALAYAMYNKQAQRQPDFYSPYIDYHISSLARAPLTCSNCASSYFNQLTEYTLNITSSGIQKLASQPGYSTVSSQLMMMLNQSKGMDAKGYYYASANFGFLTYLDSFLFNSRSATVQSGLRTMQNTQAMCSMLTPPQITRQNYEYVIGGELRQSWGYDLMKSSISSYNTSNVVTDDVLQYMYEAGEANAWCSAAKKMYSVAQQIGGQPANFSGSLAAIAASRINASTKYGTVGTYAASAAQEYNQSNYPAAIFDTDYISAFGTQSVPSSIQEMLNDSASFATNATYGVWSTQFANEAEFYMQESQLASANQTLARGYASEAYSTALLASAIANDTRLIYSSMHNISTSNATSSVDQTAELASTLKSINSELFGIFVTMVVILAVAASLLAFAVAAHFHRHNDAQQTQTKRKNRRNAKR
jgi:hypothetical protein